METRIKRLSNSEQNYIVKVVKKIKCINYLGGKCELCNEKEIFKLCFHHKVTHEKEANISYLIYKRFSEIESELKKCQLLCHNCHAELHYIQSKQRKSKYDRASNNKQKILGFINISKCETCSYDKCLASLDFHHIGKKEFHIGNINKMIKTLSDVDEKIISEINKCKIICKNCHGFHHSNQKVFKKLESIIYNRVLTYKENSNRIDRNEVVKLYNIGHNQRMIAKILKCSNSRISEIISILKKENKIK